MVTVKRRKTDILILGSGGAGLFAALHAFQAAPDLDVTIAVKGLLGKCGCTRMVQGGYNVAIAPEDFLERHFVDTIVGGKWLPRQDLAWLLIEGAVERIHELENEVDCFFDRNPDGSRHQKAFAGQSFHRTVHKGVLTAIEIIGRLMEQVWARGINRLEEHCGIALVPAADRAGIAGALLIDMRSGGYRLAQAKALMLATGGQQCTSITPLLAIRPAMAWLLRFASARNSATWKWCRSTLRAFGGRPDQYHSHP